MIRRYRSLLDGESKAAERCPRCERTDGSREKKPPPDENAASEDSPRGKSRIQQRVVFHSRRRSRVTASM